MRRALVGRDREQQRAAAWLFGSTGPVALEVDGEPGIGKSAFVDGIAEQAAERGMVVLRSRPSEIEAELAWSSLAALLGPVAAGAPAAVRAAIDGTSAVHTGLEATAFALAGYLTELAAPEGLLVVLDDAMWMDRASVTALTAPMRASLRVAWIVARRTAHESPFDLTRLFADRADALTLDGLDLVDVGRLATEVAPRRLTATTIGELHRVTGGNPLFVQELAASGDRLGPGYVSLPRSLGSMFDERLHDLSDDERALARIAALLAQPTVASLRAAAPELAVEPLLDALERARVLSVAGPDVRFVHELVRAAVAAGIGGIELARLHRRLADVVDGVVERAEHLARATFEPHEPTAAALEAAGHELVRRGATGRAGDLFLRAVELTPVRDGRAAVERKLAAADALCDASSYDQSDALYAELWAWVEAHPDELDLGRFGLDVARGYIQSTGEAQGFAAGLAAGVRAGELLERFPGASTHVWVMLSRTQQILDMPKGLAVARRALVDAQRSGDPRLVVAAHNAIAAACVLSGEPVDPLPALPTEPADPHVSWQYLSLAGETFEWLDLFDEARAAHGHLVEGARTYGRFSPLQSSLDAIADVEYRAGRFDAALAVADELDELAVVLGRMVTESDITTRLRVYAVRGDRAGVERIKARHEPPGPDQPAATMLTSLHCWGLAELAFGNWEAAAPHLRRLDDAAHEVGYLDVRAFPYHGDLVETLVRIDDLSGAGDAEKRLTVAAQRCGSPDALVDAARVRGLVAVAKQDQPVADEAFAEALGLVPAARRPLTRARALLDVGAHLRRRRQRATARARLEEARAIFESIGALAWLPRVEDEVARLGRTRQDAVLTPSERRVAELAAQGLTNKEIASALVISPRTVESTLSAVYRKLGTRSRPGLARLLGG